MARWVFDEVKAIPQAITDISATLKLPLGSEANAIDIDTAGQGPGRFIYLLGAASTVVGDMVSYNATSYQSVRMPNTANLNVNLAVAMAATLAAQYGWYQIIGLAIIKKTAVAVSPQVNLYVSGTPGRVMPTAASGKQIQGAKSANLASVTSTTSTVTVLINRPRAQGAVA